MLKTRGLFLGVALTLLAGVLLLLLRAAGQGPNATPPPPPHDAVADAQTLDRPFAWRFRATANFDEYTDLVRGPTRVDSTAAGGDFVVWKSAGTPAYQLAVVVDDSAQHVTEVLRGDDLVPSTPRQLQLYQALGWTPPRFHLSGTAGSCCLPSPH